MFQKHTLQHFNTTGSQRLLTQDRLSWWIDVADAKFWPCISSLRKKKKKDVLLEMAAYFFQSCRVQFCELFLTADLNVLFLAEWVEWRCTVERQAENLFKGLTQCCDMFCSLLKCVDFDCLSFFLSEVTNGLQILLYLTGLDCYVLVHN